MAYGKTKQEKKGKTKIQKSHAYLSNAMSSAIERQYKCHWHNENGYSEKVLNNEAGCDAPLSEPVVRYFRSFRILCTKGDRGRKLEIDGRKHTGLR